MPVGKFFLASALAGLLLGSLLYAQYTFPPQQHEDMTALLTVEAAKQTSEPGLGEVTLTLAVKGPLTLEVEEPRLGDAAAAWKEDRLTSTRTVQDQRVAWSQVLRLQQTKRGVEPLPDVSLRFRRGPEAPWAEAKWVDILGHLRDVAGPPPVEEEPSWLRRWGFVLVLAAVALLVVLAWRLKSRRGPRTVPLPPHQYALRELERIEQTLLPPQGEAEAYHTQVSYVIRRYLMERFGFQALQQTTAEFLDWLRKADAPLLSAEQQALVSELFQRCDLAKFARAGTSPDECRQTTELARELIRQTAGKSEPRP
jgi:hypothetical protein